MLAPPLTLRSFHIYRTFVSQKSRFKSELLSFRASGPHAAIKIALKGPGFSRANQRTPVNRGFSPGFVTKARL